MKDKVFNSKILLFGEYSILKNSKGLSIPFPLFNGSLKTPLEKTALSKKSNSTLLDFFKYLKNIAELDFHSFKIDLENGIYFDSQFQWAMVLVVVEQLLRQFMKNTLK